MNVVTQQKLDWWLGVPLCLLLTCTARLMPRRQGRPAVRSILLVKLAEQGSTVLAYPALCRAVEMVGRENVHCIVFEENRFILDLLGVVPEENVITLSSRNFRSLVFSSVRAFRALWKLKLDAAVDMEFFTRASAAVAFLSGARWRVGFHSYFGAGPYRGNLMTHRLFYNPHLHTTDTFRLMIEALQADPAVLPTFGYRPQGGGQTVPAFAPRVEEAEEVKALLSWEMGAKRRLILLNPNASDLLPLRRWPNARYAELAGRLLARYPETDIIFTGTSAEAEAIGRLAAGVDSKRCLHWQGGRRCGSCWSCTRWPMCW